MEAKCVAGKFKPPEEIWFNFATKSFCSFHILEIFVKAKEEMCLDSCGLVQRCNVCQKN